MSVVTDKTASLQVKPDERPIFIKPRPLPYGLRESVKSEIDRFVAEGTLIPITESD